MSTILTTAGLILFGTGAVVASAPSDKAILVPAVQAVIVAGILFAGQYVVAKMSRKGQEETVRSDSQAKATEAWQNYATKQEERLERVEVRLQEAEGREEDNRRRISALERQAERDLDLIRRLLGRLRNALREVKRLGGSVNDADLEVEDLAQTHIDIREGFAER